MIINNIRDALSAKYVVIAVMGPYAGESESEIFSRKQREIRDCGYTFWHHQSNQAKPIMVQELGRKAASEGEPVYLIVTKTGSHGSGSDTKKSMRATYYKKEAFGLYHPIPQEIYVELGRSPYALVIRDLAMTAGEIDFWEYSAFDAQDSAIKTRQGGSTVCAIKKSSAHDVQGRMKSHIRRIVAVAEIIEPYSVWLR